MWKVKRMNTARIGLKPEQAETPARLRQSCALSSALRSIVDVNALEINTDGPQPSSRGASFNVVRFGVDSPTTTQK
jgi:pilus assembly protein CpaB